MQFFSCVITHVILILVWDIRGGLKTPILCTKHHHTTSFYPGVGTLLRHFLHQATNTNTKPPDLRTRQLKLNNSNSTTQLLTSELNNSTPQLSTQPTHSLFLFPNFLVPISLSSNSQFQFRPFSSPLRGPLSGSGTTSASLRSFSLKVSQKRKRNYVSEHRNFYLHPKWEL